MRLTLGLAFSTMLLGACSTATTESPPDANVAVTDSAMQPASVELDRWKANEATVHGIRRMEALVDGYPENGWDGGRLRDSLQERMALVFERCTMEGEAHEALHAYLLPLIGMYRELPDEPGSSDLDSIAVHLARFDERFR
jgi:hypothetical protein